MRLSIWLALVVAVFLTITVHGAPLHGQQHEHQCKQGEHCCPLCQKALTTDSPYVQFNSNQVLRACSDDHLRQIAGDMKSFTVSGTVHQHEHSEADGTRCPMCGMDGDVHNPIDFIGNQALFLCSMENKESKEKLFVNPHDFISKTHYVESPSQSTEEYCSGRTVMYMSSGFTWKDTTCLVFMVESFVINSRTKLWLAATLTFGLAVFHEWLMSLRRKLVYQQREARMRGSSGGVRSELKSLLNRNEYKQVPTTLLDISVACMYAVSLSIGYVVMLSVMTYHLLLAVAAVAGFALGNYWYKDCDAPKFEGDLVEVGGEPCCGG